MLRVARSPVYLLSALILSVAALGVSTAPAQAAAGDAAGAAYVPYAPTRLVDSRIQLGLGAKLAAFVPATFAVAGVAGIPAEAIAVTGNLTVTGQSGPGWLALTASPTANPGTSTINFPSGDDRGNGVFAALAGGSLSVTASVACQVVFDVTGYFTAESGSTYFPFGPVRFLDTRYNTGLTGQFSTNVPRVLAVAGVKGIPVGASAITGNIVAVAPASAGHITVTQTPIVSPGTSTLNFPASDIRGNNFTVPLAADGSLGITYVGYNAAIKADLVLDVTGYFMPGEGGARYFPIAPVRSADSRYNNGLNGPVSAGTAPTLQVVGRTGIPDGAQAITANLAAVGGPTGGYASITPIATTTPPTSSLNFPPGDIRANGFVSQLSSAGTIGLAYNAAPGTSNFVIDITGYFAGGSGVPAVAVPSYGGMNLYRASAWSHQATQSWCTGASTQMMLNLVTGASDHSSSNQGAYVSYAYYHSRYLAKGGVGAEGDGWANAATHYGAGTYTIAAYPTMSAALRAAAVRMRLTGKPVGLIVMEGHHAWVMAGFTSTGDDPSVSSNFTLTGVIIMAPDYGTISYDPAPGSLESMAVMATKLTPYTDDFPTIWDHQYVIIAP